MDERVECLWDRAIRYALLLSLNKFFALGGTYNSSKFQGRKISTCRFVGAWRVTGTRISKDHRKSSSLIHRPISISMAAESIDGEWYTKLTNTCKKQVDSPRGKNINFTFPWSRSRIVRAEIINEDISRVVRALRSLPRVIRELFRARTHSHPRKNARTRTHTRPYKKNASISYSRGHKIGLPRSRVS